MSLIKQLESDCGLRRYRLRKSRPLMNHTYSGFRSSPCAVVSKRFGDYLVSLERFTNHCTVKVTKESIEYSKVLAKAVGLELANAEKTYFNACCVLRDYALRVGTKT